MKRIPFIRNKELISGISWLLLFASWYYLRADDFRSKETALIVTLIKIADLAGMVCICNYLLIPKLLYKKRYVLFSLAFVAMVISSSLIKMEIIGRVTNNAFFLNWNTGWKLKIYDNIIPHFFLVIAGGAIKLVVDYINIQQRVAAMAKEKTEAELEFLKQQINPHFLFNSLNTIYFQIDKNNVEARNTLHQFSEMLRYQLYETGGASIPVEKEIKYLEEYVNLQKLRKDDNYEVSIYKKENVKGFFIEPFLLIPFVENCFKHISHHNHLPNYIRIGISYTDFIFNFSTENSIEEHGAEDCRTGIGLTNVKRRLELLYPGRHELVIEKYKEKYVIQLQLKIINHE